MAIQRALLSVSDKTGLTDFAKVLHEEFGVELLSTGGTATTLRTAGLPVIDVADFTGAPEMFEGRVKTLHPMVHGGLLYRRDSDAHVRQAKEHGVTPIDLVVVNLYPFEETVAKEGVTMEEAIEQIDIGGPSMLRSAAKNAAAVTVVSDPADYDRVLEDLREHGGETSRRLREELATAVFRRTAEYDTAIANYLGKCDEGTASCFSVSVPLDRDLRYGDNPHQKARLYGDFSSCFSQLQGKELSYTNILDIEAAADLILDFRRPTVAILKHTNPCGVGQDDEDLRAAWQKAFETDRQAPFGGVIVTNRPINEDLARVIAEIFTDVIIAPDFEPEARAVLQKKKNLRLMKMHEAYLQAKKEPVIRSCPGGLMVMDRDHSVLGLDKLEEKVVTERPPTEKELVAMRFAWRIVKHVKSNAIVFASTDRTLGIGAGQMSRVDSARIAVWKAEEAGLSLKGSVIASDAMFPFADGLSAAIQAGATACIQPGGSIRDEEVIAAANGAGLSMVFTGHRHFRALMRTMGLLLGVNIDHVATLRQARYATMADSPNAEPCPLQAALGARDGGADSITLHVRGDRRHIQVSDAEIIREGVDLPLNLEMANTPAMLELALRLKPDFACLVPENREEITTEGGLDAAGLAAELRPTIETLQDAGIRVSLFIDPEPAQVAAAQDLGAAMIELHTGGFANAVGSAHRDELDRLVTAATAGADAGLQVNAGHGINYQNIAQLLCVPGLTELNIGHSIVSRAVTSGMKAAVREMKALMKRYPPEKK